MLDRFEIKERIAFEVHAGSVCDVAACMVKHPMSKQRDPSHPKQKTPWTRTFRRMSARSTFFETLEEGTDAGVCPPVLVSYYTHIYNDNKKWCTFFTKSGTLGSPVVCRCYMFCQNEPCDYTRTSFVVKRTSSSPDFTPCSPSCHLRFVALPSFSLCFSPAF